MKVAIVNDALSQLGERTFWVMLKEWFNADFIGAPFEELSAKAEGLDHDIVIRNGAYFPAFKCAGKQIALVQDIFAEGPSREMVKSVIQGCSVVIYNSPFTYESYKDCRQWERRIIPLPVDFSLFTPGNKMGYRALTGLPPRSVLWAGAVMGAAGEVKGWPTMLAIARRNPDLTFVCVFKDAIPDPTPPNMRCFAKITQEDLAALARACDVGLCTSRSETQHLAGIEMGACGLGMVAPPVGVYYQREWPGKLIDGGKPEDYSQAIRSLLCNLPNPSIVRDFWEKEFSIPVVRSKWENFVSEIMNSP